MVALVTVYDEDEVLEGVVEELAGTTLDVAGIAL